MDNISPLQSSFAVKQIPRTFVALWHPDSMVYGVQRLTDCNGANVKTDITCTNLGLGIYVSKTLWSRI